VEVFFPDALFSFLSVRRIEIMEIACIRLDITLKSLDHPFLRLAFRFWVSIISSFLPTEHLTVTLFCCPNSSRKVT